MGEEQILEYIEIWMDEIFVCVIDKSDKYHYGIAARIIQIQQELSDGKTKFCLDTIAASNKIRKALQFNSGFEDSDNSDQEASEAEEKEKEEEPKEEEAPSVDIKPKKKQKLA